MKITVDTFRCIQVELLRTVFSRLLVAISMLILVGCGEKKTEQAATETEKGKPAAETAAKEKEALASAIDAYVYAYPLVTMEYTRRTITNTVAPEGTKAPMGQFV